MWRDNRTGRERWLKEEGLADDGAEANMKSARSSVEQGNPVNVGENPMNNGETPGTMQASSSRGKVVMEIEKGVIKFWN